jgi:predicted phosphodiesterase
MRRIVQKLLLKPVLWLANKFSSNPDKQRVFKALTELLNAIRQYKVKKGLIVPFDPIKGRFIIFSDQHKGAKNGADDFMMSENNYVAALTYYQLNGYHFISLGDCEELWENNIVSVIKNNTLSFEAEKKFISSNAFVKIFGNHDLDWANDPIASLYLKQIYDQPVIIHEGIVLETIIKNKKLSIFCTHGHQGDAQSDGNWFSKFFVAKIWAPLQAYVRINPNTPAYDSQLKTLHNNMMYEWAADEKDLLLITGHTHQPVFGSLTHLERLYRQLVIARKEQNKEMITVLEKEMQVRKWQATTISEDFQNMKSCYYNSGCCCFSDGDITGIEISEGKLQLIKWKTVDGQSKRIVLEETSLEELV